MIPLSNTPRISYKVFQIFFSKGSPGFFFPNITLRFHQIFFPVNLPMIPTSILPKISVSSLLKVVPRIIARTSSIILSRISSAILSEIFSEILTKILPKKSSKNIYGLYFADFFFEIFTRISPEILLQKLLEEFLVRIPESVFG